MKLYCGASIKPHAYDYVYHGLYVTPQSDYLVSFVNSDHAQEGDMYCVSVS
jgi:hypothetical protein